MAKIWLFNRNLRGEKLSFQPNQPGRKCFCVATKFFAQKNSLKQDFFLLLHSVTRASLMCTHLIFCYSFFFGFLIWRFVKMYFSKLLTVLHFLVYLDRVNRATSFNFRTRDKMGSIWRTEFMARYGLKDNLIWKLIASFKFLPIILRKETLSEKTKITKFVCFVIIYRIESWALIFKIPSSDDEEERKRAIRPYYIALCNKQKIRTWNTKESIRIFHAEHDAVCHLLLTCVIV